jgi:hypothetical protein
MLPVYASTLVIGVLGLIYLIFGGTLAENLGRDERDPSLRWGALGRMVIGALVGFGMAGLSAEFAPLDFGPGAVFGLALIGAVAGALWARFAPQTGDGG